MIAKRALRAGPFSMNQLAKLSGLKYQSLRAWASGIRTPEPENCHRLAKAFRKQASLLSKLADELDGAAQLDRGMDE